MELENEVYKYFNNGVRATLACKNIKKLSASQSASLELPFTAEEVKSAVWDYGLEQDPGPHSLAFKFIKQHWDVLQGDFFNFVKYFENTSETGNSLSQDDNRPISLVACMPKVLSKILSNRLKPVLNSIIGVAQSAFVEGRHIVDCHLIINETESWLRKSGRKGLLLELVFEEAFDTIDWGFILSMLEQLGFGFKWRRWVVRCLTSGKASVLAGSPAEERGVRKGDPLAPLLFIIAMEGFNDMMLSSISKNLFHGISLPNGGPVVSHTMFADDVILIGDCLWHIDNLLNLKGLLGCFFLVTGLKVNYLKTTLYGMNVDGADVAIIAHRIGCQAGQLPFSFHGLPIGSMSCYTSSDSSDTPLQESKSAAMDESMNDKCMNNGSQCS